MTNPDWIAFLGDICRALGVLTIAAMAVMLGIGMAVGAIVFG